MAAADGKLQSFFFLFRGKLPYYILHVIHLQIDDSHVITSFIWFLNPLLHGLFLDHDIIFYI